MKKFTRFAGISESGLNRLAQAIKQGQANWDPSIPMSGGLPEDQEEDFSVGEPDISFAQEEIDKLLAELPEDERQSLLEEIIGQLDQLKGKGGGGWDPSVLSSIRQRLASMLK